MNESLRRVSNSSAGGERSDRVPLRVSRPLAIRALGLEKSYRKRNVEVPVLKGVDLEISAGEFTAIVGQSGSGKSTLLHLLGTLDAPDRGEIWYEQQRIDDLPSRQRDYLRNREFGLIFQFYHLLPELTVLENVLVSQMIQYGAWSYYRHRRANVARATELLDRVGLSHRLKHRPSQLSGGEMQRTAIARALMSRPKVLLADEPTGNLDRENGTRVLSCLLELCREEQLTVVMVTHDEQIAKAADAVVRLVDGLID